MVFGQEDKKAEFKLDESAIKNLAIELGEDELRVREYYLTELEKLEEFAVVRDFLSIFASRSVKENLINNNSNVEPH